MNRTRRPVVEIRASQNLALTGGKPLERMILNLNTSIRLYPHQLATGLRLVLTIARA